VTTHPKSLPPHELQTILKNLKFCSSFGMAFADKYSIMGDMQQPKSKPRRSVGEGVGVRLYTDGGMASHPVVSSNPTQSTPNTLASENDRQRKTEKS
jgi:hypothetical protein